MGPVSIWCCRWYIGHVDGVGASLGASVDTRIGPFVVLGDVLRLFGGGGLRLRHVVVWREQWRRAKLQLVVLGLLLVKTVRPSRLNTAAVTTPECFSAGPRGVQVRTSQILAL
jgi:hypothetical protein